MNWDDVRLALVIAREGSLSAAARKLGLDHGTLSRRLAAFERAMGAPLFVRHRSGVVPNRHGAELLRIAEQAEERMLALERRRGAMPDALEGPVRLATSGILASGLLARHLGQLRRSHPGLRVELTIARGLVDLARGEVDLALRLRPRGAKVAEPNIVVARLGRVGWGLYQARQARASRSERAFVRYAGSEPGAAWMARHAADVEAAIVVDDVPSALAVAKAGVGAAVLPCFLADAEPALARVASDVDEHRLFVAVHEDLRRAPRVAAVMRWLRELTSAESARLAGARTSSRGRSA